MRLTAAVAHEGDWYVARCLEVEVASQGEKPSNASASRRLGLSTLPTVVLRPYRLHPVSAA